MAESSRRSASHMSRRVVIIGAGGFAREVLDVFDACRAAGEDVEVVGWIVDREFGTPGTLVNDVPILGGMEWFGARAASGVRTTCGVGAPEIRKRLVSAALARGAVFTTVIHPTVVRTAWIEFGQGCVVTAGCILTNRIRVGDHVHLNLATTVGHDAVLADFATTAPGVHVSGNVTVEEGAYLGTGAVVNEKKRIGAWSVVGSGSVVIADVPANTTVVGVPARIVKTRSPNWHMGDVGGQAPAVEKNLAPSSPPTAAPRAEAPRQLITPSDLAAIGGGPPSFEKPLHVGRPNLGRRERILERIGEILDRRWFTNNGPVVQEFERALCSRLGVRHCIPICNGTVALEIAIRALGMTGEVIVPSYTFVATAHALSWQAITPVFCDVDPETHNLDPRRVEAAITPRTTGIIGVHLWGRACDVDALERIARQRGLQLLFDAAHAFDCTYRGATIGRFGRAEVFSFHATKFFNTFEGGAIATNDDDLAQRIRLMTNFGFAGYDKVVHPGTNGKMTEVCAAMGLESLTVVDEVVVANRMHHAAYAERLRGLPGLRVAEYDPSERCNHQYVIVEVDEDRVGITRDELVRVLWAENVLARRYFHPGCHAMEPYRSLQPHAGYHLPNTVRLARQVLALPTGPTLDERTRERISDIIEFCVDHGPRVASGLRSREGSA
jgi:sugar O-acyltransferase (sialic acid O-acetyltransferase NeuD family)